MMMSPSFLACTRSPFGMLHHQSSLSKLARNPAPPEAVDMSAFFFSFFFREKRVQHTSLTSILVNVLKPSDAASVWLPCINKWRIKRKPCINNSGGML